MKKMETIEIKAKNDLFELEMSPNNWKIVREKNYTPVEMLVSAIATCGGYVYQDVLRNSKIGFTFDRIEVSYSRNEAIESRPLKEVQLLFFVQVLPEFQDRSRRCLRLVSSHCPVIQSLDKSIEVTEEVVFF